jgi:hypothetical protein
LTVAGVTVVADDAAAAVDAVAGAADGEELAVAIGFPFQ